MSGQPTNTQSDINRFRNEYMEALNLQASIDDANLQANKTYLLTGQLPPQSQMQDTRTNAEKLKDVELLKQSIASDLSPIGEPQFCFQIVNAVMNSPLNVDNSLLRFLAQRATAIADQLSKSYKFGIAGDANDLEIIVEFIKDLYTNTQDKFLSVKSYINGQTSESKKSNVISTNDLDSVILNLQEFIKKLNIIYGSAKIRRDPELYKKIDKFNRMIINLKRILPSTRQIQLLMERISNGNLSQDYDGIQNDDIFLLFDVLKDLPKASNVITLLDKAYRYLDLGNQDIVNKIFDDLINEFEAIDETRIGFLTESIGGIMDNLRREENQIDSLNETQRLGDIRWEDARQRAEAKATKVFVVNPQDFGSMIQGSTTPNISLWNSENIGSTSTPSVGSVPSMQDIASRLSRASSIDSNSSSASSASSQSLAGDVRAKRISKVINKINRENPVALMNFITSMNNPRINDIASLENELISNPRYGLGDFGFMGLGVNVKRRGRPKGSGLRTDFIDFGNNQVNKRYLDNNIISIRHNSKQRMRDMPAKRVSTNFQNIINTIIGGGIPKFNDINNLNDEEKNYLHQLIKRSSLEDRISVPAPSKDQYEKDIHNFEVYKGEIMAGNDSLELVKKFKLLIRKLSKQKLLPRNEVDDLLETLQILGY